MQLNTNMLKCTVGPDCTQLLLQKADGINLVHNLLRPGAFAILRAEGSYGNRSKPLESPSTTRHGTAASVACPM